MKLGGNGLASAALGVRVGMVPASAAKYDNRLGAEYKKKLSERVKLDQAKYSCISSVHNVQASRGSLFRGL